MCVCVCVYVCGCEISPVDPIHALALIQTRHAGTFINVDLAVSALEASHALTCVFGNVVSTDAVILAGLHLALIDLHLTVHLCQGQSRDAMCQVMRLVT